MARSHQTVNGYQNGMLEGRWESPLKMVIMYFMDFQEQPHQPGQTPSSFALSTQKFSDMTLDLDMKTYKQTEAEQPRKYLGICMGDVEMDRSIPPLLLCDTRQMALNLERKTLL